MAWLQKRAQINNANLLYTTSLNKTFLIAGLGNPGDKYLFTRHNCGFICLDNFINNFNEMSDWHNKTEFKCLMSSGRLGEARVLAIKPTTYMNHSGQAIQAVADFYKIANESILVIHDDLDLNYGQIRIRNGGTSGGHKGIESISQQIGEDYSRLRIGIGPQPDNLASETFVLQKFNQAEKKQLPNLTKEVSSIITEYIYSSGKLTPDTRNFLI